MAGRHTLFVDRLTTVQLILLLVGADFLASDGWCLAWFRTITGRPGSFVDLLSMNKYSCIFDNSKRLCYNIIKKKSKHLSLSSNRNSFGTSLLLCYPSNVIEHPLGRLDQERGKWVNPYYRVSDKYGTGLRVVFRSIRARRPRWSEF